MKAVGVEGMEWVLHKLHFIDGDKEEGANKGLCLYDLMVILISISTC
jgi:hypothetical protein